MHSTWQHIIHLQPIVHSTWQHIIQSTTHSTQHITTHHTIYNPQCTAQNNTSYIYNPQYTAHNNTSYIYNPQYTAHNNTLYNLQPTVHERPVPRLTCRLPNSCLPRGATSAGQWTPPRRNCSCGHHSPTAVTYTAHDATESATSSTAVTCTAHAATESATSHSPTATAVTWGISGAQFDSRQQFKDKSDS